MLDAEYIDRDMCYVSEVGTDKNSSVPKLEFIFNFMRIYLTELRADEQKQIAR